MLIIVIAIMMGGNTANPDIYVYKYTYIHGRNSVEVLYTWIIELSKMIGLSFEEFRLEIYCVSIVLIFYAAAKHMRNVIPFIILYFIFPMMFDSVQTRNFMAMAIMLNAIPLLVNRDRPHIIKYIILTVLAAGFQLASLFYMVFLLIPIIQKSKNIRRFTIVILGMCIVFSLNRSTLSAALTYVSSVLGTLETRISQYGTILTQWGFLYSWLVHFIIFGISYLLKRYIISDSADGENDYAVPIIQFCYWISVISIIYFPFYVVGSFFDRLYRTVLVISYMFWLSAIQGSTLQAQPTHQNNYGKLIVDKRVLQVGLIIVGFATYMFFRHINAQYHETIVSTFFHNNWILNKIVG